MAAKTATVRMPIFHFIFQKFDVKSGCVTMAIIARLHINPNANSCFKPPARLKSATISRKIKESVKVPARVRLFRLLPQNIINGQVSPVLCCFLETVLAVFVARSALGR